jgi:hypothetical protein
MRRGEFNHSARRRGSRGAFGTSACLCPEWRTGITIDFPKEPNVMQQPQPTLPFAPAIGFARNRETAPAYWMLDLLWLVLVDGHETGGAFSVMEQWMRQSR